MSPPVDGDGAPVVGIDWPEGGAYGTLELLYEAAKETAYADNDPVETPTQFGALTDVAVTQGTLGSRPQFQSPCDVGSVPCFYSDGGDTWVDGAVRASLSFLHNGAGMSCYLLTEASAASAAAAVFDSGAYSNLKNGSVFFWTAGATRRMQMFVKSTTGTAIGGIPTGGEFGNAALRGTHFQHGTSRNPDALGDWRGPVSSATGTTANYSVAVSAGTQSFPSKLFSGTDTGAAIFYTGHTAALACYSALHGATEIAGVWAAVEAETGALPQ
jgi:hypothetical protein